MITTTLSNFPSPRKQMPTTDEEWIVLSTVLHSYIKRIIHTYSIIHWQGSEQELAEDVLTETYLRAIHRVRDTENGIMPPIGSFEALCKTIAKYYLLDLRRKDKHLIGSLSTTVPLNLHDNVETFVDPAEIALEDIELYTKMQMFSQAIQDFSPKQKEALLINLANMADFDNEQPFPLERALWKVGIRLREYRRALPEDPVLRSRHFALVCMAYKRLRAIINDGGFENTRNTSQTKQTASMVEQNTNLNKKGKTMDATPREEVCIVQTEELSFVDRLQEPYRQAIQLHCVERWSYPETAAQLGLPIGTVKSHVSRGLKMLHLLAQQKEIYSNVKEEQKQRDVLTNLHKLEGPCRKAVQLHYLEGRSYPEVAAELQVPLNTAKSYVHRGMKVLCA